MVLSEDISYPRRRDKGDRLSNGKRGYQARLAWERRVGYRYWKPLYLWWIVTRSKLFRCYRTKKHCPFRGDTL